MPSSKWRSERSGPNWLMDEQGRLIGYRDEAGNEYKLPSKPAPGGINDTDEPSSSVSGAGSPIAYAALATTSGAALGERRTLSDGPDAGAEIVWSIPEGASMPTWCWAIYPLASYL